MSTTACNLYRFILTCHCHCPYAIITASHEHFITGTNNLIGRDAECASGFSVAHAHASLNTSSPSYASGPKSAICASVYRRYLSVSSALATLVLPHIDICHD